MKNFVVFFNALISDISGYTRFISEFADSVHKISVCPKFSTPQFLFHFRMLLENLSCCQTFHHPHYLAWTHPRYALNQKMDMIFVNSNLQKTDLISFRYFKTDVFQTLINCFTENNPTVLSWTDKMVKQYRYIMRLVNVFAFAHTLKVNFSPQAAGN
jgi:hypothetical protein